MAFLEFDRRLRRIERKHQRMSRGRVAVVDDSGLVSYRARRRAPRLPLRGLLMLAAGFLAFKALVLTHLGAETYDARLAALQSGTVVEQAGAWLMQADPVTVWIAQTGWSRIF